MVPSRGIFAVTVVVKVTIWPDADTGGWPSGWDTFSCGHRVNSSLSSIWLGTLSAAHTLGNGTNSFSVQLGTRSAADYSILFYSRLCPSTAGSSPPPESSIFFCPLLSSSIPLLAAPQCHLSNDVLVFRLILHPLSATLCF